MQLKTKITLTASATLLALTPALLATTQQLVQADSSSALSGYSQLTPGHENSYQSASATSSGGQSFTGIGFSDQFLTNPITLAAVPNFDFGYHKKTEGKDSFPLVGGSTKRYLVVDDKNGLLDWNVSAQLGDNTADLSSSSTIKGADVSIALGGTTSPAVNPTVQKGTWLNNSIKPISVDKTDGLSFLGATLKNSTTNPVVVFQHAAGSGTKQQAGVLNFNDPNSAWFMYDKTKQPVTSAKYVAPITWTLSVTA
ncbi:WxL domain-containing protein [Bombilactobacillus bombi]|uniref:WxL domain-containing protein n=1 Tax=Bombilactobacillus bombi TaxID=1303590 RepID=UPI0035EDED06